MIRRTEFSKTALDKNIPVNTERKTEQNRCSYSKEIPLLKTLFCVLDFDYTSRCPKLNLPAG